MWSQKRIQKKTTSFLLNIRYSLKDISKCIGKYGGNKKKKMILMISVEPFRGYQLETLALALQESKKKMWPKTDSKPHFHVSFLISISVVLIISINKLILPFILFFFSFLDDHSRIILKEKWNCADNDYINANYIKVKQVIVYKHHLQLILYRTCA